jgi:hypothetical protein
MSELPNPAQPIFREVQTFRQIWIWLIVIGTAGLFWYALITQIVLQRPFGSNPLPDGLLIFFWLIFAIGLPIFTFASRLITEVREDGIYLRFIPFHMSFRRIGFETVDDCQVRTYKPIREYGGWGIRRSRHGIAYNVRGDRGVQLDLVSGRHILIGSQLPEALFEAIQSRR